MTEGGWTVSKNRSYTAKTAVSCYRFSDNEFDRRKTRAGDERDQR